MENVSEIAGKSDDWAVRSEFWINSGKKAKDGRIQRQRNADPLILCGHGISLRIEKGTLQIRDGLTHYPQDRKEYRFFRGDLALPPRIILLDGSGSISFDVLDWLCEQKTALIRISWDGHSTIAIGPSGLAGNPDKIRWQIEARNKPSERIAFGASLIRKKLKASIATLEEWVPDSPAREAAISKALEGHKALAKRPASIDAILGIEGAAAVAHFTAWRGLPLSWKATKRYPIPEAWHAYRSRPTLANRRKPTNRNASHPLNAMLNYAYAVLESEVRIGAVADGYDPTLRVFHSGRWGSSAFVFDLMEPLRPVVDGAVLRLVADEPFSGADFVLRSDGVVRLNPQLAKRVAQVAAEAVQKV